MKEREDLDLDALRKSVRKQNLGIISSIGSHRKTTPLK